MEEYGVRPHAVILRFSSQGKWGSRDIFIFKLVLWLYLNWAFPYSHAEDSNLISCSDWPMSLKQVSTAQKNRKKIENFCKQCAIRIVAVFPPFLVDTSINQGNMKFIYFLNTVTVLWNYTSLNYIYFHFRHADGSIKFWDASSGKEKDYKIL